MHPDLCGAPYRNVVYFNYVLLQSFCYTYKLLLMCAKYYQIWLRCFKDKIENVRWPHFFDDTVYLL